MKVIDPGHIYELQQLGGGTQRITFVKRSGGAIHYEEEWAGLQTQEVLRALIDRTIHLNKILPCTETEKAIQYLRLALFEYEARAYRRKKQGVNRTTLEHAEGDYVDVPFNEYEIEKRPIGEDGHILIGEAG